MCEEMVKNEWWRGNGKKMSTEDGAATAKSKTVHRGVCFL